LTEHLQKDETESFVLNINGQRQELISRPDEPLLWVLRDKFRLTGAKFGCGKAKCGACTILVNDKARHSCRIRLSTLSADDRIETIEAMGTEAELSPLQAAFVTHNAFGCGYCTPGQIMSATALLRATPKPDRQAIDAAMNGNLCRCASYPNIIKAIESVVEESTG